MASSSQDECLFDRLPTEILLYIGRYLPDYAKVVLAQTSSWLRSMFLDHVTADRRCHPELDDKLQMLVAWERMHPDFVYCPDCARLRHLKYDDTNHSHSQWNQILRHRGCSNQYRGHSMANDYHLNWSSPASYSRQKRRTYEGSNMWEMGPWGLRISFLEAHAVMHRHRYGAQYGLPIYGLKRLFLLERWLPVTEDHSYRLQHWPLEPQTPSPRMTRARARSLTRSRQLPSSPSFPSVRSSARQEAKRLQSSSLRAAKQESALPARKVVGKPKAASDKGQSPVHQSPLDIRRPWYIDHEFDAAVIDEALYIKRSHVVSCSINDEDGAMKLRRLEKLRLPICEHIMSFSDSSSIGNLNDICPSPARKSVVQAPELRCLREQTQVQHRALRSCVECYTDYWLSINWGHGGRHQVELTTYHRLGPCKTVHERAWQTFALRDNLCRIEDHEEFGPGVIASQWHMNRGGWPQGMDNGHFNANDNVHDSIIPHWSISAYDRLYNPLLEKMYGILAVGDGLTTQATEESKSTWFCDCGSVCTSRCHGAYIIPDRPAISTLGPTGLQSQINYPPSATQWEVHTFLGALGLAVQDWLPVAWAEPALGWPVPPRAHPAQDWHPAKCLWTEKLAVLNPVFGEHKGDTSADLAEVKRRWYRWLGRSATTRPVLSDEENEDKFSPPCLGWLYKERVPHTA